MKNVCFLFFFWSHMTFKISVSYSLRPATIKYFHVSISLKTCCILTFKNGVYGSSRLFHLLSGWLAYFSLLAVYILFGNHTGVNVHTHGQPIRCFPLWAFLKTENNWYLKDSAVNLFRTPMSFLDRFPHWLGELWSFGFPKRGLKGGGSMATKPHPKWPCTGSLWRLLGQWKCLKGK